MKVAQRAAFAIAILFRQLRFLKDIRGWHRIALRLTNPRVHSEESHIVYNRGVANCCNLQSLIEWRLFVLGSNEAGRIALFLDRLPPGRRRTILDIGGNVGSHALAFASVAARVHTFEANPEVCRRLQINVALNPNLDVSVHRMALGAEAGLLEFFAPLADNTGGNMGTGSFVAAFAPDRHRIIDVGIETGDSIVEAEDITDIDAVKIDTQGFEPQILAGLARTLRRDKPVVWFEVSDHTAAVFGTAGTFAALFPYPVDLYRYKIERRLLGLLNFDVLAKVAEPYQFEDADYLAVPR